MLQRGKSIPEKGTECARVLRSGVQGRAAGPGRRLELHPKSDGNHRRIAFFNKFIYFIYLLLATLGLCCCARAFSSCGERGLLFVAVRRLLIAMASLVAEHRL